jgi:hypothetical protein
MPEYWTSRLQMIPLIASTECVRTILGLTSLRCEEIHYPWYDNAGCGPWYSEFALSCFVAGSPGFAGLDQNRLCGFNRERRQWIHIISNYDLSQHASPHHPSISYHSLRNATGISTPPMCIFKYLSVAGLAATATHVANPALHHLKSCSFGVLTNPLIKHSTTAVCPRERMYG